MKVIVSKLAEFTPELIAIQPDQLAQKLWAIGFEAEVLDGGEPALELSVTPNRADGMSHLGIARDLRAYLGKDESTPPETLMFQNSAALDSIPTTEQPVFALIDKTVASQYHVVVFDNVTIQPSPDWLQRELELLGIRPINNVVDVTNYLMELYGQPLHAFDADSIQGDTLTVRASKVGETLETLDGIVHTLPEGVAVIEDASGLIDLAGIRGGKTSEVRAETKRVLLQSAIFDRSRIRKAVNALQYRTAASTRFERGVDPAISLSVLSEAARLITSAEFGEAKATGKQLIVTDEGRRDGVTASANAISKLLGLDVLADRQAHLLRLLGCEVTQDGDTLVVMPPTWRFDLGIWQDLAEEIERLTGLDDAIPATALPPATRAGERSELEWAEALKDKLTAIGLSEVQTYSFISAKDMEHFQLESTGELANPLNPDLAFLRPSLLPNLANVVASNGLIDPIAVFEIGHVFTKRAESTHLGIAVAGAKVDNQGWIEALAKILGTEVDKLMPILHLTQLNQAMKDSYKIRKRQVTLIEVPLEGLLRLTNLKPSYRIPQDIAVYKPISKFPPVTRDIAVVVDQSMEASDIIKHILDQDVRIEAADLFDEFSSDTLGVGKKSLAFHIYYADPTHTLTNDEATKIHTEVQQSLIDSFKATIR